MHASYASHLLYICKALIDLHYKSSEFHLTFWPYNYLKLHQTAYFHSVSTSDVFYLLEYKLHKITMIKILQLNGKTFNVTLQ